MPSDRDGSGERIEEVTRVLLILGIAALAMIAGCRIGYCWGFNIFDSWWAK